MRTPTSWIRPPDQARVDVALAGLMIAELELELWLTHQPMFIASHRPVQSAAAAVYAAPLAVRRRWPAAALLFLGVVAVMQAALGAYLIDAVVGTTVPPALLGYAVGTGLELRPGLLVAISGAGLMGVAVLVSDVISPPPDHASFGADLIVVSLLVIGPWLAGRLASERGRRAAAFSRLAEQAAAEREQRARAVIAQERIRIGRELQDIIIHSVSMMVIQAGGARRLLQTEPDRARDSILIVERTGRAALADLRRLLGMLRKDEDPRALAPQPGLAQLTPLVDRLCSEGLACELVRTGEPVALTPGTDLVGYRVIEAGLALLNRARAGQATVKVHYGATWLELDVRGEVRVTQAECDLRGISERVSLYDGQLQLLPGDGFSLRARLPLADGKPLSTAVPA